MKLDPDLMRQILLDAEEQPAGKIIFGFNYDGREQAEVNEHVQLLIDEGFLDGKGIKDGQGFPIKFAIHRITMPGHQFLANSRNNTIWKRVIADARDKGMSTSMVVINGLLSQAAKKYAGLE